MIHGHRDREPTHSKTAHMNPTYRKARKHLGKDKVLAPIIERHGPCTLKPEPEEPFIMLVRCVVGQQISTKAARSIYAKLLARVKARLRNDSQRPATRTSARAGISGPKQRALRAIVEHVQANRKLPEIAARTRRRDVPHRGDEDQRHRPLECGHDADVRLRPARCDAGG